LNRNSSDEWWDDEYWKVKSFKHKANVELVIVFKVHPHFEGNRKKGQGIWEIDALTKFPDDWTDKTNSISSLSMAKGKFDVNLEEFISGLNKYRNQIIKKENN